jgi:hypothetical protein
MSSIYTFNLFTTHLIKYESNYWENFSPKPYFAFIISNNSLKNYLNKMISNLK